jgi:hypothetical protein
MRQKDRPDAQSQRGGPERSHRAAYFATKCPPSPA